MAYKLLLADDSVTIQRVIELTFADEDIQVVAVGDGEQAIAHLEADPPDIVLADVGMPGRDGYEVAAHLKRSPRLAHIPVVLLTGAFEPVDQARFEAIGCDGVLAKPFEPQLVIGRVKELLARARAPVAAAPAHSADLQRYFDRIDEALAAAPGGPALEHARETPRLMPLPTLPVVAAPPPPEVTQTQPAAAEPMPPAAVAAQLPAAPKEPARPATPRLAPLADAFAALLAAEQGSPLPSGIPVWPAIPAPRAAPVVTDELIEQVSRRVLDRLSDRVVRETVAEIVTGIAERLVREEIERLKASIEEPGTDKPKSGNP